MRGGLSITVLAAVALVPRSCAVTEPTSSSPRSVTIAAVGDLVPDISVLNAAARAGSLTGVRYDFAAMFAPVAPLVERADLAICHMETPVGLADYPAGRYGRAGSRGWRLLTPFEAAAGVKATGFDRCSTASNHSADFGMLGIDSTLAALDAHGLSSTGTARNPLESGPRLMLVNGVRIVHLSYTRTTNSALPPEPWRVAWGDPSRVAADVDTARAMGAEIVVVSLHMGTEGAAEPNRDQRAWANEVTSSARVDLVVMHGPHTVQPVEVVNGTWVFWSLGNFVSGMGPGAPGIYGSPSMLDGLLASARFDEDPQHPGRFVATVTAFAVCVEPSSRSVHAATTSLADPAIPQNLRTLLAECLRRTQRVVPYAA